MLTFYIYVKCFERNSCYLRPEENPRVINYSDPAKAFIMEDATNRYE